MEAYFILPRLGWLPWIGLMGIIISHYIFIAVALLDLAMDVDMRKSTGRRRTSGKFTLDTVLGPGGGVDQGDGGDVDQAGLPAHRLSPV